MQKCKRNGNTYFYKTITLKDGKRKAVYGKKEWIVEQKILDIRAAERDGLSSEKMLFKDWAEQWLNAYKKGKVIEKSYNTYKAVIENHLVPEIGKKELADIRNIDLQIILNKLDGMSRSHLLKVRMTAKAILRSAVDNKLIAENPAEKLTLPCDATEGTHRPLSEAEEAFVVEHGMECKYGGLVLTVYYCGLRDAELATLHVEDIDFDKHMINICRAFESASTREKVTKTKAGMRSVPIPEAFEGTLKGLCEGKKKGDYVFTTPGGNCGEGGKPFDTSRIAKYFNTFKRDMDILSGAKVKNNAIVESIWGEYWKEHPLTLYCMRHTYCTNLQKAKIPLNVAKYLMGHKDIAMTSRIYTHQTEDQTEMARELIDKRNAEMGTKKS